MVVVLALALDAAFRWRKPKKKDTVPLATAMPNTKLSKHTYMHECKREHARANTISNTQRFPSIYIYIYTCMNIQTTYQSVSVCPIERFSAPKVSILIACAISNKDAASS